MRVKVVKNKVAAPFRQAEFDIEYGQGISSEGCILDLGIEHGIVQKSGSFFSYGDERLGQGRNNVKGYLRENPAVTSEIERKIYDALGVEPAAAPLAAVAAGTPPRPPSAAGGGEERPPRAARRRAWTGIGHGPPSRSETERAIDLAYKAVGGRERTVAELRTALERKRVEPDAIEEAVEELTAAGFLDDARYARPLRGGQARARAVGLGAHRARAPAPRRRAAI